MSLCHSASPHLCWCSARTRQEGASTHTSAAVPMPSITEQQPSREESRIWKEFESAPPKTPAHILLSQGLLEKSEILLLMSLAVERHPAIIPTVLLGLLLQ